jgi:hypothetical protein
MVHCVCQSTVWVCLSASCLHSSLADMLPDGQPRTAACGLCVRASCDSCQEHVHVMMTTHDEHIDSKGVPASVVAGAV